MVIQDESWRAEQRRPTFVLGALAALSMVPLLVEFGGFRLSEGALLAVRLSNFAFAAFFVGELAAGLGTAKDRVRYLRRELVDCVLAGQSVPEEPDIDQLIAEAVNDHGWAHEGSSNNDKKNRERTITAPSGREQLSRG